MQALKTIQTHHLELGLKALTISSQEEQPSPSPSPSPPHSFCNILASSMLSLPTFCLIGDCIGMESCLDLKKNEEELDGSLKNDDDQARVQRRSRRRVKREQRLEMKKKEFPPPITSLARTENLPSHMPWVMKRYYTEDGRLIIREEKVKHHEYFRAHRENGRLTLHLVPLDNDALGPPLADEDDENENEYFALEEEDRADPEIEENVESSNDDHNTDNGDYIRKVSLLEIDNHDSVGKVSLLEDHSVVEESRESGKAGIGGNGGGKCLSYDSVRTSSSCIFGMPLPAIGPLHT